MHAGVTARAIAPAAELGKSRRGGSERGLGLGLAVARQIGQAHGGWIGVKGFADGVNGICFPVQLPSARTEDMRLKTRENQAK